VRHCARVWLCLALLAVACNQAPKAAKKSAVANSAIARGPAAPYAGTPVKLELFLMSRCPFGITVEKALFPVLQQLGRAVDFRLGFIGRNQDGQLSSKQGPDEVADDLVQICAARHAPAGYLGLIARMNESPRATPDAWEKCARESGVDVRAVRGCKEGPEGQRLLAAAFDRSRARGVKHSPMLFVDGAPYEGRRKAEDLLRAICRAYQTTPPAACADLPGAKVAVAVIGDQRCQDCQTETLLAGLRTTFKGLEPKVLDYADAEAKAMMKAAGIKVLPAFLFDRSVELDKSGYAQVRKYLVPAGAHRSLQVGATWDPTAEICDNGVDDNGDGKVDCADATCKARLACRPEEKTRLDLFVMSQCPHGMRALDAMNEVLPALQPGGIRFAVHFIVGISPDGALQSTKGPAEIDEDLREICAIKHYPARHKFMDYIWCRNRNLQDGNWQSCTGANGIAPQVIAACATGPEGKALLAADAKLADALKIDASPTFLVNNRTIAQGLDPESIKTAYCARNQNPGCDKKLTSAAPPAAAAATRSAAHDGDHLDTRASGSRRR
jgi:hypothetical protein